MKKLLIGSNNPAKINTFSLLLAQFNFQIVSPKDLDITDDVEETGSTFKENALLKARFYHKKTGLACLSDDGGIEIDALGRAPGVYSHRWAGTPPEGITVDQHLVNTILEKMKDIPRKKRTARIVGTLCLILPDQKPIFVHSAIEGLITDKQEAPIQPGFPYRSIFFATKLNKLLAHADDNDLKTWDHRRKSIEKLSQHLT
jgi:XTP/dITP diphosphohydrolase